MGTIGQIYICSGAGSGFNNGNMVEVINVDYIADMITVSRLSTGNKTSLPLSTFNWIFSKYDGATPSFDDLLGKGLTTRLRCECGVAKTYTGQDTTGMHSNYCPLSSK